MTDQLIIFDTPCVTASKSPGASMTRDEKLRIARPARTAEGRM